MDDLNNYLYDSLSKPYKVKMEWEIHNYKIPNFIILTVAWIDLKEAKPILKKAYLNNSPNFDRYYLQIALAKFGDIDALVAKNKFVQFNNFIF